MAEPAKNPDPKQPEPILDIPVRLLADVWLEEDVRTPAGKVVSLPREDALRFIDSGKAERADPLPGA